ncbi:MAG: hypothetical protein ACREVX_14365 [Clostridium sp.]|uniref:hypothetical protein n=1 Tax=Clostridium sp. TaxID=1506 RepID=UPI003D6CB864
MMKEESLKQAQKGIDDALDSIDVLEETMKLSPLPKDILKENFDSLSKKVEEIEELLKNEGIL